MGTDSSKGREPEQDPSSHEEEADRGRLRGWSCYAASSHRGDVVSLLASLPLGFREGIAGPPRVTKVRALRTAAAAAVAAT